MDLSVMPGDEVGGDKTLSPFGVVLLALLSTGVGGVGSSIVFPIISRPDPYTGTQGEQERAERIREDERLWQEINRLTGSCWTLQTDVVRLQEKQSRDHAK
jgi:hypothetical protein